LEPWRRRLHNNRMTTVTGITASKGYIKVPQHIQAVHNFEMVQ
uniref:Uncharacterized protein n=1 Tax=Macaca mulatta TaxID=9544 RepID=A0A5F8A528_MACMU